MKILRAAILNWILVAGLAGLSIAGSIDSPGAPSSGSGMYTLSQIYDFLNSGTEATPVSGFQEPGAAPGSTMKTTKQIYDDIKDKFFECDTTVANVEQGKKFFCTQSGSWGVQTGIAQLVPTITPTITPTTTPTPYGVYASCKAIKTTTPSANDGIYTIDPDGSGGNAPFDAYCDMTADGGGWTLVVRIKTDLNHRSTGAVGVLTSPTQTTSAKLSDPAINLLATELFRFSCHGYIDYFDANQNDFGATNCGSSCIFRNKDTYSSSGWQDGEINSFHCGLSSYPQNDRIIYTNSDGSLNGCYKNEVGWDGEGMVFTR
ncbi:MAG: fibrinogen-like YCDxxxxGGGW domain-containing protein [Candidatus Aureabacteria bacterium]|nr:fibrinogen-like YCDxxxxGGGW domain-containing protein [Candidatus Auribacterota bacterium]